MHRSTLLCSLLLALTPFSAPHAKDGATGTVTLDGESWPVADAVARVDGDDIELAFARLPWDRKEWARDGKFEQFDLFDFADGQEGPSLRIEVDAESKGYGGHTVRLSGSSSMGGYDGAFESSVTITSQTADRIAGSVKMPDTNGVGADVTFDLPILREGPLARAGKPLPPDGGAPGKALRAMVDATQAGDVDAMLKLSNPERRAGIEEAKAAGELPQMLAMAKLFTPNIKAITGGTIDGDTAAVDFIGLQDGEEVKGTGDLVLVDGVWYVEGINTSSGG